MPNRPDEMHATFVRHAAAASEIVRNMSLDGLSLPVTPCDNDVDWNIKSPKDRARQRAKFWFRCDSP
eukprot:scaffold151204_cov31-Tisochrysis_lutea.AAC.2